MNCPGCRSARIRRSHRRSMLERMLSAIGRWPYRCWACGRRFFLWVNAFDPDAFRARQPENVRSQVKRDAECVARVVIRTDQHQQMDEILSALHRAVADARRESGAGFSRRGASAPHQAV
jgi:hypothetical protein